MSSLQPSGTLFLVPTPIGNDDDISPRALRVLGSVSLIAAEDTRVAAKLLARHKLGCPLTSYHDHNEDKRTPELIERLSQGQDIALVSDAGTPLVHDPGYRLVVAATAAGIRVCALPGPCAAVTALSASGLPVHQFLYAGFLPRQAGKRADVLRSLRGLGASLVFYVSPHRVLDELNDMAEVLGNRPAALGWNLTKAKETYFRGTLGELRSELAGWDYTHGEMTLVIAGNDGEDRGEHDARAKVLIGRLVDEGLPKPKIRDTVSEVFGLKKSVVYRWILETSNESSAEPQ